MRFRVLLLALPLVVAACGPQAPPTSANGPTRRNVVAKAIVLQPLEVKIKLPVVTRAVEEVELRATMPGNIVDMPFDKGDKVEASSVPPGIWEEAQDYINRRSMIPTEDEIALRNLEHLKGVKSFALIDDAALVQAFREAQSMYDQAVRDLQRLQGYPDTTGSQLDQARTRRDTAKAAALRARSQIENTRICSPVSGIVTERARQKGEYVNPGELIARVAVLDRIRADVEMPEAHYSALSVGDAVDVTLTSLRDAAGKSTVRKGLVARKDSLAHPQTHSFTVEIEINNADLSLPAGIFGTVQVTTYKRAEAIVVPLSAIKLNGPKRSLFVLKGEQVKEVTNIRIGQLTMEWAEILGDAIKPGDRVVTTGAQWLGDGDLVTALEKDPTT
ncbi:MAG: efflux RND transporter periplasmic adaptor subunit [Planctomycetes bacterium]|nr:efflux RND transporter periplasmic adaptor subunit [Planctomycetota bacterium]